jgi:hypothetical protein
MQQNLVPLRGICNGVRATFILTSWRRTFFVQPFSSRDVDSQFNSPVTLPPKKSIKRKVEKVHELTDRKTSWQTVMARVAHNKAQARVELAESAVRKCSVRSPFAGRLHKLAVQAQQCVRVSQPLFELVDNSELELVFKLPVSQMEQALPGTLASLRIKSTGKTYPVRIICHCARADPLGHTLHVFAAVEGNFPALMAGMSGMLQLSGGNRTLAVPFGSVQCAR